MKKVVYHKYGGPEVLTVIDTPVPQPASGEVLIKVMAAGVNPVDYKIRQGSLKWLMPASLPRSPGGEISGIVEKVGPDSGLFKAGDKVFAMLGIGNGGYAQYVVAQEKLLCSMPHTIDFEHAAVVPLAGLTALQSLRDKGKISSGMKVLINGASGGVGIYAVQIAKAYNTHVTATCSGKNIDLVKSLGADIVIDYQKEDFTRMEAQYDIVFDAVAKTNYSKSSRVLSKKGVYVTTVPNLNVLFHQLTNVLRSRKSYGMLAKPGGKDLKVLAGMIEEDRLKAVIDKSYSLSQASAAHEYIASGRVKGKLVIKTQE